MKGRIYIKYKKNLGFNDLIDILDKIKLGINDYYRIEENIKSTSKLSEKCPKIESVSKGSIIIDFMFSVAAGIVANTIFDFIKSRFSGKKYDVKVDGNNNKIDINVGDNAKVNITINGDNNDVDIKNNENHDNDK